MAAVSSFSFSALGQSSGRKISLPSTRSLSFNFDGFLLRPNFSNDCLAIRPSNSSSSMAIRCTSSSFSADIPTVAETKLNFLNSYKRPIPSIYNTVLQELIVQHHLMKYKKTFQYDAVFGLGFVTVYDQLMDGYQSDEDREAIFQAYIKALKEDPEQYRNDANRLEEWAKGQNASSLIDSTSREGILKDIAERAAAGNGRFSYSRFFAIGLFRLLELANATDPTLLEKLCAALNINKKSVDRDLDVYRNLLSKLVQAKELLKEYVDREKKKQLERSSESQKASEAITKCLGEYLNVSGRE